MTTFRDFTIATECCKFAGIINDLFDCCRLILRNIDPNTGDITSLSIQERKDEVAQRIVIGNQYYNALDTYIAALGQANISSALSDIGIDGPQLKSDIDDMYNEGVWLNTNLPSATTEQDLETGAAHIEANIPKLPLFRRSWNL